MDRTKMYATHAEEYWHRSFKEEGLQIQKGLNQMERWEA